MAKILSLHGTTVAEILESGLENLEDIDAISLSVLWKDGTVTAGWSSVDSAKLAFMVLCLEAKQRAELAVELNL